MEGSPNLPGRAIGGHVGERDLCELQPSPWLALAGEGEFEDPLCRRKVPHVEAWFASSPRTGPLPLPPGPAKERAGPQGRGEAEAGLLASLLTGPWRAH